MSVKGKRTIWAGPADQADSKNLLVEGVATAATMPGMVVSRGDGLFAASTIGAANFGKEALVAVEYGDHIDADVDTEYASGDLMLAAFVRSGEFVNVMLADGQSVVAGDSLVDNGDVVAGTVRKGLTDGTEAILFYADETLAPSGANALVRAVRA